MEGRISGKEHQGRGGNVEAGIGVTTRTHMNLNATGKMVSRLHANNATAYKSLPINQTTDSKEVSPSSKAAGSSSTLLNSQHFMEPQGLLPCPQELSPGHCPQTDQSSPHHPILYI
jgi:hypothetical protein